MKYTHVATILVWSLGLSLSCAGEVGMQGPPGPQGSKGDPGTMGAPGNVAAIHPDCPIGYTRDQTAMNIVVCKKGNDEVVRVGRGGSAFWIDRYEASVWEKEDGSGSQYGAATDDYPSDFPKNGQSTRSVFALSKTGVMPSRLITWFQANEACAASGKRLPTNAEWQLAARGTPYFGANNGNGGACLTSAAGPRHTGLGSKCVSDWGAQDMVGNLMECTMEWYSGLGAAGGIFNSWPGADFNGNYTANITSSAHPDHGATAVKGIPSIVQRGGGYPYAAQSGVFSFALHVAPTFYFEDSGFRCVVPR